MTFSVSSSNLFSHLQAVSKVINSKNSLPILNDVLFMIEGNNLTLIASDQETIIRCTIDLIESDGDIVLAIPAKNLLDSLKEISSQPISFNIDPSTLEVTIRYQNGQFNFMAANGDEFPQMKELTDPLGSLTITAPALLKGITSTIFASADDEIRPVMNGVVLDISTDSVTFVASDTHKLVRLTNTAFHGQGMDEGTSTMLIVRKKPSQVLKSILTGDGDVNIVYDEKRIHFQYGEYIMSSLLIEGRFPKYNSVIPTNNPFTIWIDRLSFLSALKRVSLCSDESNNLVKFDIADNVLKITAQNPDFSTSAEESVTCQYDMDPIAIGFKASFLVDILSNLSTTDVVMKLADSARAGLFLPSENEENQDLLMLLMPMMIKA